MTLEIKKTIKAPAHWGKQRWQHGTAVNVGQYKGVQLGSLESNVLLQMKNNAFTVCLPYRFMIGMSSQVCFCDVYLFISYLANFDTLQKPLWSIGAFPEAENNSTKVFMMSWWSLLRLPIPWVSESLCLSHTAECLPNAMWSILSLYRVLVWVMAPFFSCRDTVLWLVTQAL